MSGSKAENPHMWVKWEASGAIGTTGTRLEMPTPTYLMEMSNSDDRSDGEPIKWVGIKAYSPDGEIKEFLWWRNVRVGNLNNEKVRNETAASIARIKLEMQADMAIGPLVDLDECDPKTGFVKTINERGGVGVYVEAKKRPMFNFFIMMMERVKTEEELRRQRPVEFNEALQKAKQVLPRPKAS